MRAVQGLATARQDRYHFGLRRMQELAQLRSIVAADHIEMRRFQLVDQTEAKGWGKLNAFEPIKYS